MPAWVKAVLRTVGVLNAALAVIGVYLLLSSVRSVLANDRPDPNEPYFRIAFVVMSVINGVFVTLFLLAAFQLLRLRKSGVLLHVITSTLLVAYVVLNGILWAVEGGVGRSIAAASGVGNMGIGLFEILFVVPELYPIASSIVLLVARRKIATSLHGPARLAISNSH